MGFRLGTHVRMSSSVAVHCGFSLGTSPNLFSESSALYERNIREIFLKGLLKPTKKKQNKNEHAF